MLCNYSYMKITRFLYYLYILSLIFKGKNYFLKKRDIKNLETFLKLQVIMLDQYRFSLISFIFYFNSNINNIQKMSLIYSESLHLQKKFDLCSLWSK